MARDCVGAASGAGVYAGGGSFEGVVNAFMPGRSGRRVAGDDEPKGLFDNGGTPRPGVDLRFMMIECVVVLVEEVGLEFLRANFFLMLPSILPESRRRSDVEGSSLQVGPEWNGERTVINILLT